VHEGRPPVRSVPASLVAFALALALVGPVPARGQVSPGPLARAHATLDKPSECYGCHARGGGMTQRCLACHTGIAAQRESGRGLHGREARSKDCNGCHPDHAGRDFDLVHWDEGAAERFDHRRTGYPLTGKHATLQCTACHVAKFQRPVAVAAGAAREPAHRWNGLATACTACHQDPHQTRFGNDCEKCHTTKDWKAIEASRFDHDLTRYPLRGKHVTVRCERCHDPASPTGKRPPFATCGTCHKDAHGGLATLAGKPADCEACHNVQGFEISTFTVAMHQRSKYPLEGRHAEVKCASCHPKRPEGSAAVALGSARIVMRPPYDRCTGCHADAHGGLLAARADKGACESCHRVSGWKPSRFAVSDHAALTFKLEGAHARTPCADCHAATRRDLPPPAAVATLGSAKFAFKLAEKECVQCHYDVHRGRFAPGGARVKAGGCRGCHDAERWRPAVVSVAAHADFGFALEAAHRAVPCTGCHAELKSRPDVSSLVLASHAAPLAFDQNRRACVACHEDVHQGQFAARREQGACQTCHGVESWRPAARFMHDRDTAFKLEGAHARVACASCHPTVKGSGGRAAVRYHGVPADCVSCHGPTGRPSGGAR
jgi:hypothetical protein